MSQSSENTWSATDAKESQQEIANLVGKIFGCIFFELSFSFASYKNGCIGWIYQFFGIILGILLGGQFVIEEGW